MKKVLITFIVLVIIISAAIIYLNQVFLPAKIKSLIVSSLQEATQKKVSLQALQFHIFKGLVLKNLAISDSQKTIVSIKEVSCAFIIPSIFKKTVIIPTLKIKSPAIFLERREDSTFNIQDLFLEKTIQAPKARLTPPLRARAGFGILIYKISVTDANIHFKDNTLSPAFTKDMEILHLVLNLSLPASVKFTLKSKILASPAININAIGEYKIFDKQFSGLINIKDFSPGEFQVYYQNLGITIPEGRFEALIDLNYKDNVINAKISTQSEGLSISKDKVSLKLNSQINADLKYNLTNKQREYSGIANITKSNIIGLEFVGPITDINGGVQFDNAGIISDKLNANIWAIPVEGRLRLSDFKNPWLSIDLAPRLNLNALEGLLRDKFNIIFPADIHGRGNLSLKIETRLPAVGPPQIKGSLDIIRAILKLRKVRAPIEEISGRLEFDQNQLKWPQIKFKYLGLPYKTTGVLTNFQSPSVQLELSSTGLSLESVFTIEQRLVKLTELQGRYLNSKFSLGGEINTAEPSNLEADVSGQLNINLPDIKELLKKFSSGGEFAANYGGKDRLEQIKPEGVINAQFKVKGNINNPKSCAIEAQLSSPVVSAYGLRGTEFLLDYGQAEGIADISRIYLSFYDGTIEAGAKMNLNSENLPFWVSAAMQGVKIEKLKLDTVAKEKDICGTISTQLKINGFSKDISKLSGAGQINIAEGNLWQLNLFKGLGALLFVKDFSKIIFSEGSCGFSVQDKYIFTDNLKLKSNIAELAGSVKIGFDSSVDASLNVHILDEMVPLTGTFKDVTSAIIGQAGKFGVIKISGTLKEPKYKFQPAVADIIGGLKDVFFGK